MAWAIRRADGTYRAYMLAQDTDLRDGETWVELFAPPPITLPLALQNVDAVRDAYVAAKQAVQALAVDASVPAVARQAVVRLGQCLEALLRYLNRQVS